jgi:hypothetical protein
MNIKENEETRNAWSLLLLTQKGRRLTKRVYFNEDEEITRKDGNVQFGQHWKFEERKLDKGLESLEKLLRELQTRTDTIIVRGSLADILPREDGTIFRRTSNEDTTTNHLCDRPKIWLDLDLDLESEKMEALGIHLDKYWDDDVESVAMRVVEAALPEEFHTCGWVLQFSTGMDPWGTNFRAHLWLWLSRPITCAESKAWLADLAKQGIIDDTKLQAHQPNFTSIAAHNPKGSEIIDPLADVRITLHEGTPLQVPDDINIGSNATSHSLNALPSGTMPTANKDCLRKILTRSMNQIGDKREGGPEIGLREGLLSFTLAYARATFGTERDAEFARQLATEKVEADKYAALLEPWGRDHIYHLRLGKDFDAHLRGAIKKVDANPEYWVVGDSHGFSHELNEKLKYHYAQQKTAQTEEKGLAAKAAAAQAGLTVEHLKWLLADTHRIQSYLQICHKEDDRDGMTVAVAMLGGVDVI